MSQAHTVKLYRLILSQLMNDGYTEAAEAVSRAAMLPIPRDTFKRNYLSDLCKIGLHMEEQQEKEVQSGTLTDFSPARSKALMLSSQGLDLDVDDKILYAKRRAPDYKTRFITTHKKECRCAKFSPDGKLVATGSTDTSIKLIDVEKMKNYNTSKLHSEEFLIRPTTRTFYDHIGTINDVDFHPHARVLMSCSQDSTIKFYDYSKPNAKKAFRYFQDTHPVRSVHFHPSGDYILAGTEHHMIRLYDVNTFQAYTCAEQSENHAGPINMVRYSVDGSIFASCSKDGAIKLWDGVSNRCINTIPNAHSGFHVSCIQFTANKKYLMSGGKDSTLRLWELSTGRQVRVYKGGAQTKQRMTAAFSYNEDFLVGSDETSAAAIVWDSRTGELVERLTGHNGMVRAVASSPVEDALLTCSDDHRARFWVHRDV
eukprot:TRINITY_DN13137_c0_g1_i1.p1 TRINITY_DN13137_c0_g1~~TRINITY_DN13137_c0_g1_i1.p1  ORF type:complete len:426 (-),score=51.95 TRINITY_DN13137_c0_g1_i1:98-1375(-)